MYHVGGIEMNLPIMVGAGACKTPASMRPYMQRGVSVGAVSMGSTTPDARLCNEGTIYWPSDVTELFRSGIGLNSFGMPNSGIEEVARQLLPRYLLPVIASFAGFSVKDYVCCAGVFDVHPGIAVLKANVGCGNTGKLPFAYDCVALEGILKALGDMHLKKPLWLKLSPYITAEERDELQGTYPFLDFSNVPVVSQGFLGKILSIVWDYEFVRAVVFSNTLPNVIYRDATGKPATTPYGGKAGLSGKILKSISLNLIRQAATMLPGRVDLIASGGMLHGDDVVDAFEEKATAVFFTSGPFWSGNDPRFFADVMFRSERLQNYLTQHSQQEG